MNGICRHSRAPFGGTELDGDDRLADAVGFCSRIMRSFATRLASRRWQLTLQLRFLTLDERLLALDAKLCLEKKRSFLARQTTGNNAPGIG